MTKIRVVFMGTPDFAVASLDAVVDLGYDVLVVTQPDRPVGRKRVMTPSPVKRRALELGLTVLQPEKIRDTESVEALRSFAPHLMVTAAYGQILPKRVLAIPSAGAVNVHASLLPRWRGAAPIQRAIIAGDSETGVTLMEMVQALDAGPMIESRAIPIEQTDTFGTLHDKLAELGARICRETLPEYVAGKRKATPQDEIGVTYAEKIERVDEFIDWRRSAFEVDRQIRGLYPWPGATAVMADGQTVKIWRARPVGVSTSSVPIGVGARLNAALLVQCGEGVLELEEVQPAGKRRMAASAWFAGLREDTVVFQKDVSKGVSNGVSKGTSS